MPPGPRPGILSPMTGSSENPKSEIRNPTSDFDWHIFADATCAGLAVLIPLPLVDLVFEALFRRRMPGAIARTRGRPLEPALRRQLGRGADRPLSLEGCLSLVVKAMLYVLTRIWRKIIYILAVRDSVTAISRYWHRAFLIDHMLRAGHLEPAVDTELAVRVFRRTVQATDPGPLTGLARQTVASSRRVLRLLLEARRLGAATVTRELGQILDSHWDLAADSLAATAERYNRLYRAELDTRAAASGAAGSKAAAPGGPPGETGPAPPRAPVR